MENFLGDYFWRKAVTRTNVYSTKSVFEQAFTRTTFTRTRSEKIYLIRNGWWCGEKQLAAALPRRRRGRRRATSQKIATDGPCQKKNRVFACFGHRWSLPKKNPSFFVCLNKAVFYCRTKKSSFFNKAVTLFIAEKFAWGHLLSRKQNRNGHMITVYWALRCLSLWTRCKYT